MTVNDGFLTDAETFMLTVTSVNDLPTIVLPESFTFAEDGSLVEDFAGYLDDIDGEFDVLGVDWSTPMQLAKEKLGNKYVLQGNMEPTRLYSKEATKEGVEKILSVMGKDGRHIFNLGHGILPDVPVQNAIHFVNECKRVSKK